MLASTLISVGVERSNASLEPRQVNLGRAIEAYGAALAIGPYQLDHDTSGIDRAVGVAAQVTGNHNQSASAIVLLFSGDAATRIAHDCRAHDSARHIPGSGLGQRNSSFRC